MRFGPPTCPVCWGKVSCRGGGFKQCAQRDPHPSHIAAILDTYGGVQTVVGHKRELKHLKRPDDILVVAPKPLVHQPIYWGDSAGIVHVARHWLEQWMNTRPNEPHAVEAIKMYRLRRLELNQESLDLNSIVET